MGDDSEGTNGPRALGASIDGNAVVVEPTAEGGWAYRGRLLVDAGGVRRAARVSVRVELLAEQTSMSAPGRFLGGDDDALLENLARATVVRAQPNKGGSALSFRLD